MDFLELLLNFLNVGDLVSRTGEEVLALFGIHSNFFAEFMVGLIAWIVGFGLLLGAVVMLMDK